MVEGDERNKVAKSDCWKSKGETRGQRKKSQGTKAEDSILEADIFQLWNIRVYHVEGKKTEEWRK